MKKETNDWPSALSTGPISSTLDCSSAKVTPKNTNFLAFRTLNSYDFLSTPTIKDYQVEDGWELLFVNFGTPTIGVAEPSYALYNRYDGMVRTFVWLTANEGAAFNSALLKIRPFSSLDSKNSALFENINSPANALDDFEKKLEH